MKKAVLFLGLFVMLLSCTDKTPKCSDIDVKILVREISKDLYEEKGFPTVKNIRSISKDEAVKRCDCEAEVLFSNGNKFKIEYFAQHTDDKKVYVEVSNKE